MSIAVQATPAPTPKTKNVTKIAVFYAIILVGMAVAQLFTFDEFLKLMTSFTLLGDVRLAHFIAAILVVAEVFALPFLLRMSLSPAFRWLSMVSSWAVAAIWLYITTQLLIQHTPINNVGFLGTAIDLLPGWWSIFISVAFGILAAWSSWGMWPYIRRSKRVSVDLK